MLDHDHDREARRTHPAVRNGTGQGQLIQQLKFERGALPSHCRMDGARAIILAAHRRLNSGDVDLPHLHHRIERALGGSGIGIGYRPGQSDRRNLP